MHVGELARRTGASARSIRYYEQEGLITAARARNGYRQFDDAAVEAVRRIRELLANGLTVEDVRAAGSPEGLLERLRARRREVGECVRALQCVERALDARIAELEGGCDA